MCVHCLNTVVENINLPLPSYIERNVMKIECGRFEKFASFQVEWLIIFQMSMKGLIFFLFIHLLNGVFLTVDGTKV
jgi:hypothetical protein